jgi:hypothetical protein
LQYALSGYIVQGGFISRRKEPPYKGFLVEPKSSRSTDPFAEWERVKRRQRHINRLGPILLVLTLLLAAWGVIDPIGPDFNWGPMWR